ncbi:MAG: type IV secretion system DNA-binding domain-containing protein [Gammaproteobacteria bacterium]|nr:type IV secretion system DNA-binding domain-containing protein [Gammaproteobacteria bacterium]
MVKLLTELRQAHKQSPLYTDASITTFIVNVIDEAIEERWGTPGLPLADALYNLINALLYGDAIVGELPTIEELDPSDVSESVRMRAALRRHERFLRRHDTLLPIWRTRVVYLIQGVLEYFPPSAFIDVDEGGLSDDDSVVFPSAHVYDLCEDLPQVIERTLRTFYDVDISNAKLFEAMRDNIEDNLYRASGVPRDYRGERAPNLILPTQSKLTDPRALVDTYLHGTPFHRLFTRKLPFAIPFPARFEHTHIVGGTGHGKTQMMQFLIHHDLVRAKEDGRSVVVLDSQGDLIRTISHLDLFSDPEFRERFVLVDPNDIEHPVCLNMFDFNRDRLSGYAPVDREKILNATIELYEYFFGALLGADLTQRQGLIFRYLARLLMEIPDATIHTLRELMEDGDRFKPYMEKLTGTARSFFASQFFEPKFRETKKQILTRLWGVLSNTSLERMFSHSRNRIDIFELLNQGKIILINTAKDLLGQDGAAIFGRFFIALIAQASIQRAAMPPHMRRPSFVYIDECQDYFDDNISNLLNQARKYRVGLIFAHQNLDQLSAGLRSSVLASTTIKFAGGVSAKDANTLDAEFRCKSDFLLSQKKEKNHTEFACFVKNYTRQAISVSIPFGFVEGRPQIEDYEYEYLIDCNRELYSAPPMLPADIPFPQPAQKVTRESKKLEVQKKQVVEEETLVEEVPLPLVPKSVVVSKVRPKDIPEPGRGGRQHKYLQHLIKQLGEERGFRATIEETILGGAGRVDVSLARDGHRVAFQVSMTTTKDWELGGIEKCLAHGYSEVVLVGSTERHIQGLSKFIEESLEEKDQGKVRYLTAEGLLPYLDSLGVPPTTEKVVKGYKVRTVQQTVSPEDVIQRRKAVAEVIARSLKA